MLKDAVYVVAKAPRAGQTKTRLCPPFLPEQAALLAAAFLRDTIALALRSGADVRLICRDEAERVALLAYAPNGVTVHVQTGSGLGAALQSAFSGGSRDGYRAVAVLGMDTPSLSPRAVSQAFTWLREPDLRNGIADVVLGPSIDGGYYLLAARTLHTGLFRDMVWSTSTVAAETLARCASLGLRTRVLERQVDVDDVDALHALRHQLAGAPPDTAPFTRAALRQLDSI